MKKEKELLKMEEKKKPQLEMFSEIHCKMKGKYGEVYMKSKIGKHLEKKYCELIKWRLCR